MMTKLKYILQPLYLIAALTGVYQLATAAQAMNVYNDTTLTTYVDFSCGWFCSNDWTINAGDMKSRPNESGNLAASIGSYGCDVYVDTHGWVVATGSDFKSIVLTSYHQDGSVRETCTFYYQSRLTQVSPLIVTSEADSGDGSLRSVIAQASSGDTITFADGVKTIVLASPLVIGTDLTISGPEGSSVTLNGNNEPSVLSVNSSSTVKLSNLTITGGFNFSEVGVDYGGGIINEGTLTITNSTVSGNRANSGGGIYNNGTLTVTNSTITRNGVVSQKDSAGDGGGIYNNGTLTVTNSTVSGNTSYGDGGGIYNSSGSTLTVTNSTVSGNVNENVNGAGGIANVGILTLNNSIVALNTTANDSGGDITGSISSGSNNIVGTDPGLDPAGLKDNGGPTQTIALLTDSPALDAADSQNCPATDQRGVPRPQGDCDIGAFELVVTTLSFDDTTVHIADNPTRTGTVTLSKPAPAGGVEVNLSLLDDDKNPSPNSATFPASVTIPENQVSTPITITFTRGGPSYAFAFYLQADAGEWGQDQIEFIVSEQ